MPEHHDQHGAEPRHQPPRRIEDSIVTGPRPRLLVRTLIVIGLLAGLFAMHGLSADHDTALSSPHHTGMTMPRTESGHLLNMGQHVAGEVGAQAAAHAGMGKGCCVAVLTGAALLALLLIRLLRTVRVFEPLQVPRRVWRTVQAHAPPRPPDLAALCVLRI